jgi:hypothetical protein
MPDTEPSRVNCDFYVPLVLPHPYKNSTMAGLEQTIDLPFIPQRDQIIEHGHMNGVSMPRLRVMRSVFDTELDNWHVSCYPVVPTFSFLSKRRETPEAIRDMLFELERLGWTVENTALRYSPEEWY